MDIDDTESEPLPVTPIGGATYGGDGFDPGPGDPAGGAGGAKKAVPLIVVLLAVFLVWRLVRRRRHHRALVDDAAIGILGAGILQGT